VTLRVCWTATVSREKGKDVLIGRSNRRVCKHWKMQADEA
jgi:hypothetical protein